MEGSPDEGLSRAAAGDRIMELADHRRVATDPEVHAATPVEAPAGVDLRLVDHPLGVVLTLDGELDLAAVPMLQERLDHAMRGRTAVVIDLSRLSFIDSSGLELLVRAERQMRDSGGRLVLVRGPRAVHRLFELTSLDSYIEFCESPSAALRAALERRTGGRRIPKPPRTDRARSTSTATTEG